MVPAGPGSSTDTIMRSLAQAAAPLLGQSIVILNKPGASGTIGVGYVTRSEPDGYTIGGVPSGAITMAPHVAAQSFQPTDYRIVAMITQAAGVLCVHPDFPAKNATEFLAELKNNPDKYTYGSDGVGAFVQFSTARIFQPPGIRQRIIPYSGADQTVTAFISRTIDIYGGAIATIAQFVAEGKAKCLLLTTARRFATLPDVESLEDVKMAQAQTLLWRAVIAPRDIPQDRFDKLRDVLTRAAQSPGVQGDGGQARRGGLGHQRGRRRQIRRRRIRPDGAARKRAPSETELTGGRRCRPSKPATGRRCTTRFTTTPTAGARPRPSS